MRGLESVGKALRGLLLKRPGVAVALWGEAGIGKTHAARGLLRDLPLERLESHATVPLADLVRALPRRKRPPAWAARLREKLEADEFVPPDASVDTVAALMATAAPFVLHLEDLHEASPERLEWLVALARTVIQGRGTGLMVTSRVPPPEAFQAVRLEPLDEAQTRALLETEISAALPEEAVRWIETRAAGNPLYTLEFFRHLARQGFAWNDGRVWHWRDPPEDTVPVGIEALIEAMLQRAARTPGLEAVVQARAMLPPELSAESLDGLWADLAGLSGSELGAAQAELERALVLRGEDFAHPLYRELTRRRLPPERERSLARTAVHALEDSPELAVAFVTRADLPAARVIALFDAAMARLRAAGRDLEAARLQAQGLEYRAPLERSDLALAALKVISGTDFALSTALLELARQTLTRDLGALEFLAVELAQRGDENAALGLLERFSEAELPLAARLEWQLRVLALSGNTRGALALLETHPELLHSEQPQVLQSAVHTLALAGRAAEASEVAARGLARPGLSRAERIALLEVAAVAQFYQGQVQEAVRYWSESLELARLEGLDQVVLKTTVNRAQALIRLGDTGAATQDLETASKLARDYGDRKLYAQSLVMLGVTLTEAAHFERAEEVLLEARSALPTQGAGPVGMNAEFALVDLYRAWESPHRKYLMAKHAQSGLEVAQALGLAPHIVTGLLAVSSAEHGVGRDARALETAERAVALAAETQRPFLRASALRARAEALRGLARRAEAIDDFLEVARISAELGLSLHEQENRLEVAQLRGDLTDARARLEWFETHGHRLEAQKARRYFPELAAPDPAPAPSTEPTGLSLAVLGPLEVHGPDHPQPIRGRKRQQLLLALLEARLGGRPEATKLELLDALYPDTDEPQGASALKETVRLVRGSLGARAIQTTPAGYALGAMSSDAERFLATGDTSLWRGPYAGGGDDSVREALYLALQRQAETRLESDPHEAARLGRLLLEYDPYDLRALRLTVAALRASDNHKSLNRLYTEARTRFEEVGETLPERWQHFLEPEATARAAPNLSRV